MSVYELDVRSVSSVSGIECICLFMNPMGKLVWSVSVCSGTRWEIWYRVYLFMNSIGKLELNVSVYELDGKAGIKCICL